MTRWLVVALFATMCGAGQAKTDESFGGYYRHTRWIEPHHALVVDAFPDHIVIAEAGKQPVVVRGCWRGRAFLRACRREYFGVAYEGRDASIAGDPRFAKFTLTRVRPDPKT